MSKIKKKCARSIMDYIYVLWTNKIQICAYVCTHTYGCSKESVQVFKQKLLAVIFLLREISYGLVILSHDFDRC